MKLPLTLQKVLLWHIASVYDVQVILRVDFELQIDLHSPIMVIGKDSLPSPPRTFWRRRW